MLRNNPIKSQNPTNIDINKKPENYPVDQKTKDNNTKLIKSGEWRLDKRSLLGNTKGYEEEGV